MVVICCSAYKICVLSKHIQGWERGPSISIQSFQTSSIQQAQAVAAGLAHPNTYIVFQSVNVGKDRTSHCPIYHLQYNYHILSVDALLHLCTFRNLGLNCIFLLPGFQELTDSMSNHEFNKNHTEEGSNSMKVIQTGDQVTKISFSPPENSIIFFRGNKIFWFGKKIQVGESWQSPNLLSISLCV